MTDGWLIPLAFLAGLLLGAVYFGGLWWTVSRGLASAHPEIWFLLSLVLRMSLAVGGFLVVSGGKWERLVACLAGFVLARCIVLRWIPLNIEPSKNPAKERAHAP